MIAYPSIVGSEDVSLEPFEEIRGRLEAIRLKNGFMSIELSSGTLRYNLDSKEAKICEAALTGNEGAVVSILYTSAPDKPVHVNVKERDISPKSPQTAPPVERKEAPSQNITQLALSDRDWAADKAK